MPESLRHIAKHARPTRTGALILPSMLTDVGASMDIAADEKGRI